MDELTELRVSVARLVQFLNEDNLLRDKTYDELVDLAENTEIAWNHLVYRCLVQVQNLIQHRDSLMAEVDSHKAMEARL